MTWTKRFLVFVLVIFFTLGMSIIVVGFTKVEQPLSITVLQPNHELRLDSWGNIAGSITHILGLDNGRMIYVRGMQSTSSSLKSSHNPKMNWGMELNSSSFWLYATSYPETYRMSSDAYGTDTIHIPAWIPGSALALPFSLWLIFKTKRLLRRDLRVQTGYCLNCGFNLTAAEDDICPECGAARPLVTLSTGQR